MKPLLALTIALAALLIACGDDPPSDEQLIRQQFAAYTRDLAGGDFADACRRVTDPPACIAGLRSLELLAGGREELLVAAGATPGAVESAKRAVVSVRGDRATVDNPATPDDGLAAMRANGEWRLVFPENR